MLQLFSNQLLRMSDTQISKQRKQLLSYTNGMVLPKDELMSLSATTKLKICQITPAKALKDWPHGKYVPVWYIERCLNFISDFDRWCKVQRECYEQTLSKNNKVVHQARVVADFYIIIDWKRIERSCYGARQMYDNPAVSKFSVIEAARSIATKSFADTLWIASDKLSKELDEAREKIEAENIPMDKVVEGFEKTE